VRGTSAAEHEASLRKLYTVKTVQVSRSILFILLYILKMIITWNDTKYVPNCRKYG